MPYSPKRNLWLFLFLVVVLVAQATWWIVFMARLLDEKVDLAEQLGGSADFVQQIHEQEISRQIMLGMEGTFFLLLMLVGAWLIYRALVRTDELKFHQQNFLMAVTHELKTPLASMKIYLDTLESQKVPAEKKEHIVPRMREDVTRLERMVENILDAGRFERAGYRLNESDIDLSDLVQRRLEALGKHATPVPVNTKQDIEQGVMWHGDPSALSRAIDAILENSLKYHNGQAVEISVQLSSHAKGIILTIADNGIGFHPKDARALFERFYRLGSEMTRKQSGSGLGLYLCREIIRAHGGEITASSPGTNKGATFTISLKRPKNHENHSTR